MVKTTNAANFLRSAKAPLMSAGVMAANIIWKVAKRTNGMVLPSAGSMPTPWKKMYCSGSPTMPAPPRESPKARLKPTTTQTTVTMARPKKLCMIVERTLLARTRPP